MQTAHKKAPAFSSVKPRDFAQHAFNFLNDSGRTTVGVVYSPSTLAASAVYFAFKYFEIQDIAKRKSKKSVMRRRRRRSRRLSIKKR